MSTTNLTIASVVIILVALYAMLSIANTITTQLAAVLP